MSTSSIGMLIAPDSSVKCGKSDSHENAFGFKSILVRCGGLKKNFNFRHLLCDEFIWEIWLISET